MWSVWGAMNPAHRARATTGQNPAGRQGLSGADKLTFWVPNSVLTLSVAVCVAACVGEKLTLVSQKAPAARVPAQLEVAA